MTLAFSAFELDPKRRTLSWQGKRVALLSRPFDILVFLIAARDRVVSREEMQTAIWPGQIVTANNLNVQISMLRRVLAQHDASELIITVPGRGYRFIGEIAALEALPAVQSSAPEVDPAPGRTRWRRLLPPAVGLRSAFLAVAGLAAAVLAAAAMHSRAPRESFPAHVQVETVPDTVTMVPDGFCKVDYIFRVREPIDMQLATEDVSFSLTSGEPIGRPAVGGRIYHGSFPITGGGTGVYRNNIWLPPAVAEAARASNRDELYLRHSFHLIDPHGTEVIVLAVLKIVIGSSAQACSVPAGR